MHQATFVADLAVVLGVAAVTGVLARLLRQPSILGYLLAGLVVGPYLPIPVFADFQRVEVLAEFGVILVMFAIGLEFRIGKLLRVLPISGVTGLVQVSFLLWCGFNLGRLLGWSVVESVFLGASVCISSTMVVSRVLDDRPVSRTVRDHVFGVLILQDVLAIALIATTTAIAAGGGLGPRELAFTLGRLGGVLAGMLVLGMLVVPRFVRAVARLGSPEILAVVSIGVCFVIAELAAYLGYSVALGAFIAGILFAESGEGSKVEHLTAPMRDVFAAIFFVSIGMTVDPRQIAQHLPTAGLVFVLVVGAQFASVAGASVLSGLGLRRAIVAGLTLGQIGEFSFIIAAIGIGAGVVRDSLQSVLVTVAVLSAFTTAFLVGRSDQLVEQVDRRVPRRFLHLLGLYEQLFERFRATRGEPAARRSAMRAVWVLAADAIALVVMLSLLVLGYPYAAQWLHDHYDLGAQAEIGLLFAAGALLGSPIVFGLVRNTLHLQRFVQRTLLPENATTTPATRLAARTLPLIVGLMILLASGVPAIAVLRPLLPGPFAMPLLGLMVLGIAIHLWRNAAESEADFRSAAEQILSALARQGAVEARTLKDPTLPPGLDRIVALPVAATSHAVGMTLAELNLRALTGATVVAIHRGEGNVVLPTGHERFQAGDVLAVTGTAAAMHQARKLIAEGPTPAAPGETAA